MKALGMLIAMILTTMPVHAINAQSEAPTSVWPMAIGLVLFFAAVVFCLTAMKRIATDDLQHQKASASKNGRALNT